VTASRARHVLSRDIRSTLREHANPRREFRGYRRILPIGAVLTIAGMTCVSALPASADVFTSDVVVAVYAPQTYAAGDFVVPAPQRDGFTIGQYFEVQWPLPASTRITSGFGYRSCAGCSEYHQGIDLTPGNGYPIEAIADGVVVESAYAGALGQHVIIKHVIDGQVVLSLYGHMQAGSNRVSVGDEVQRGEVLGLVGSTGQSTGPHLHFGIQTSDGLIDPYPWMLEHVNT
jgi:murein DD-endopeptidase MepM/ murein hydrolase activator NlpD